MQPTESPVAIDALKLPPLCNAELDDQTLTQLETDLQQRTVIHSVQVKLAATQQVGTEAWTLPNALTALRNRQVRGVQIAYHHESHEWTDTLLRTPDGYRLVRVQHLAQQRFM